MAKSKFNLAEVLGDTVSKLNTMQVREIPLSQLEQNPDNSYAQTGIDELAESIEVVGLQQPLVVVPVEGGRFRILAGHRRRSALEKLERKTAPCVVLDADLDPSLRVLILHWTNTMARGGAGLTAENTFAAAKEIKEALLDLKQRGVIELPGKLRASCLHRFRDVYDKLGWLPRHLSNIDIWNLRGKAIPMDKLAPTSRLRRTSKTHRRCLICWGRGRDEKHHRAHGRREHRREHRTLSTIHAAAV